MATKPAEEQTRLDRDTEKALLHDFVYRPDMKIDEIADYLDTDWDDAYNWTKDQLKQAKDGDK